MIVDTSALAAIIWAEPRHERLISAIDEADAVSVSAATLVELYVVLDRRSTPDNRRRIDQLLRDLDVQIIPFTASQAAIAREAYRDYGRGSGHPAHLNFGDCFAYALASETGEPLLYVGDDFIHTDLRSAV